ncbi:hypothetical protein B0J18DRAFT_275058 [Chaetomium sp. MPI-SDFR-AT-0129]|nr:hypothetical protein B0J18DRAFT_275058 [Chaetomium sp. MPI-SDFR-AT-0129]
MADITMPLLPPLSTLLCEGLTVSKEEMWQRCKLASEVQWSRRSEALLKLPLIRDIHLRSDSMGRPRIINLNRSSNIVAVLIQLTGTEADVMCERCTRSNGPFRGCIVSVGLAACASCQ